MAWRVALARRHGPTALVLTRQKVPVLDRRTYGPAEGLRRGGYVLADPPQGAPELILIGTGSEVALVVHAQAELARAGVRARAVSLPSWELFEAEPAEYRDAVLPPGNGARLAVEAGATFGWELYVGLHGLKIGIDRFGVSAPAPDAYDYFGLNADNVAVRITDFMKQRGIE